MVIDGWASVVGRHEYEGPLGSEFDAHDSSGRFGADTWERAESEMQRRAINLAFAKASGYRRAVFGRSCKPVHLFLLEQSVS